MPNSAAKLARTWRCLTAKLRSRTLSTIRAFLLSNALHQLQRAIEPNLEVPGRSARSSALGLRRDPHGSVKQIHHEELEDGDKQWPSAFPKIMLKQTDSGIQQLHGAGERTQDQQQRRRLLVDRPQCEQSQRNCSRRPVHCQYQRRLGWNGFGRDQVLRTNDRRDGKAARDQDIDCRDQRSQPHRPCCCH